MSQFRTQWLVLLGAALLLALSVSSAFGARPTGADTEDGTLNHGQQVSDFVHSLLNGDDVEEEVDEDETDEDDVDEDETDVDTQQGEASNHGACVVEVAQSDEVGPPNDNQGGAVSLAARVTCWLEEAGGESTDELEATSDTAETKERGKSAAAHDRAQGQSGDHRGQGRGHGRH